MATPIKIPNFWSQEYRLNGINCAVLNRLSVAVGTDNVAGGRMLKFSAYDPATRVLTMEGAVGMVGKALFLYTIQDREPRRLLVVYKDPVNKAITLASDPDFSADELAAVAEWRGAVPDILIEESSFVCGDDNFAVGPYSFVSGRRSLAAGIGAHAEGTGCRAIGNYALAFGLNADAIGDSAIAIGRAVKVAASCAVLIGDDGELPDTPENAGAFAIANDGLLVIVRKTAAGAELTVNGTVRAAAITDLEGNPLGGSGGVTMKPAPVLPGEYYLIRRERYAVGCLRTDSYVESGDPENPMPELVSIFSEPKVIASLVTYRTVQHTGPMPLVIDPAAVAPIWFSGGYAYVETPVIVPNGAFSSWMYQTSAKDYGVYLMSLSPEIFWDFAEQVYIVNLLIKKTVGEDVGVIEYPEQLKLLAGETISGEPHLLPEDLGLHEDAALAFWTGYYPTLGSSCPAYKVMEV